MWVESGRPVLIFVGMGMGRLAWERGAMPATVPRAHRASRSHAVP